MNDERETRATVGHPLPEFLDLKALWSQVSFRLLHLFNKHKAKKRSTLHSCAQINKQYESNWETLLGPIFSIGQ